MSHQHSDPPRNLTSIQRARRRSLRPRRDAGSSSTSLVLWALAGGLILTCYQRQVVDGNTCSGGMLAFMAPAYLRAGPSRKHRTGVLSCTDPTARAPISTVERQDPRSREAAWGRSAGLRFPLRSNGRPAASKGSRVVEREHRAVDRNRPGVHAIPLKNQLAARRQHDPTVELLGERSSSI